MTRIDRGSPQPNLLGEGTPDRSSAGVVTVVGYDGGPLDPRARDALAGARLVAGGARHLAAHPLPPGARRLVLGPPPGQPLAEALDVLAAHPGPSVVVASGDPGFFGIVRALRARGLAVEVLPARSSVALAFARIGQPWDDAVVVSAHGRDPRAAVNACRAHPTAAVLTAPGAGPAEIGAALEGWDRRLVVCERLGAPDERVTRCTPAEAATRTWAEPNVVLSLAPDRRPGAGPTTVAGPGRTPAGWALPEREFSHRESVITKAEVRALVLARLGPRLGDLVWDVGAGSGSVGVECARLGAAVIAVDRDGDACARVRHNAGRHGVEVRVVRGAAPEALSGLPAPDAVFVGGGGADVLAACARLRPSRLVAALAALDRVAPAHEALIAEGYTVDAAQLQAARLAALPDGALRLAATNPVFVLSGSRP